MPFSPKNPTLNRRHACGALGLSLAAPALRAQTAPPAAAGDVVQVDIARYPKNIELEGQKLVLNGAGTRTRFGIIKAYALGLYLPKRVSTLEEILALPGSKRAHMVALRELDGAGFGKMLTEAIEKTADRATFIKLIPALTRLGEIYAKSSNKLFPGDQMLIDSIPGVGTIITNKGVVQGAPITEPAYFPAILDIWVGNKAVDSSLRQALLGQTKS